MQAWLILNAYTAVLICMLMFFNNRRELRRSIQSHAFGQLLLMVLILVVMDSLSRSGYGDDSVMGELSIVGTYIVMAFHPFIYYFSLKYVIAGLMKRATREPTRYLSLSAAGRSLILYLLP